MQNTNTQSNAVPWGWLLAGAAALGLGFWMWRALGPDLQRYMKIRSM